MTIPTPDFDPTTRLLAEYLKTELDAALGSTAVEGLRDHYTKLNTADTFPLLMVYRTTGTQQETNIQIDYYLPAYNGSFPQPGIMNWARYYLIKALQSFGDIEPCIWIDPVQSFDYQLLFSPLDRSVHPLVRVTVTIEELV